MSKPEIICINKSKIAFFVFRQCKGRNMFSADYYEFSHVPFIVQPLAVIVQLSVQVLRFSPYSKH